MDIMGVKIHLQFDIKNDLGRCPVTTNVQR